jgi:exosortase A
MIETTAPKVEINGASMRGIITDRGWAGHLCALALSAVALVALFARDAADMTAIWWNASTYNHCMLIPPIAVWLVMQRRAELAALQPRIWLPGLGFVLLGGVGWILGEAAGIALFRHAGLVFMLQSLVPVILGPVVTRALLFPLFYLAFMVPAGEELVPMLQTITAKMCMGLLGLFGIPAHINGIFITIPNGYFEVAEACSGVKFLVAMVAYGALVANVCFKRWKLRMAFMAVSVIVPILANGLRAFGTIYVAHLTTSAAAEGFDHVVYGWFFFGFVMMLVMAIGWKFFDRGVNDPWLHGLVDQPARKARAPWAGASAAIALALVPLGWNAVSAATGRHFMPQQIALPAINGWTHAAVDGVLWAPTYKGADHALIGRYANAEGKTVDLAIVLYAWQGEGRELTAFGQGAAGKGEDAAWTWAADTASPKTGKAERIVARGPRSREALTYYRVNGVTTGEAGAVKLATLKARLLGGNQAAAAILVSAEDRPGKPARPTLDRFVAAMGPPGSLADALMIQARGH